MAGNHKSSMRPRPGAPPGLETDGQGNVIPFARRTPEDQAQASRSLKDPEQEAQAPSSMPRTQQGSGGASRHGDPAGHQGGYHR
jgi:hypothetical protein